MENKFKVEITIFGNQPATIDMYKLDILETNHQDYNVQFVEAITYSKGVFTTNRNNYKHKNKKRLIPIHYFDNNRSDFVINHEGHLIVSVYLNDISNNKELKEILNGAVKVEIANYTKFLTSKLNQYEDLLGVF